MTSMQRPSRRRNARHAFEEEEGNDDTAATAASSVPVKKAKVDDSAKRIINARAGGKAVVGGVGAGKKNDAAYDEDVDGFQFSRTRSKSKRLQAKAAATDKQVSSADVTVSAAKVPTRRKKGLAVLNTNLTTQVGASTDGQQPPRRRSARLSGGSDSVQPTTSNGDAQVENAKRRKLPKHQQMQPEKQPQLQEQQSRHISSPLPDRTQNAKASPPATIPAPVTIGPLISTPNEIHVVKKRIATKIALPFADTPVIQRNKDMRKNSGQGHRRSSGGMRGRRASSLIEENKSNAVPHAEVETREFYKHIAQDLLEPKRMKQLLVWCGSRALPEKPLGEVENANERMTARVIQEELLKEFANNSDLSDIFKKRSSDSTDPIKRPNPRNIQNANKLKELQRELERLKAEKKEWDALMLSSRTLSLPEDESTTPPANAPYLSSLDLSLLSPSETYILNSLISLSSSSSLLSLTIPRGQQHSSSSSMNTPALSPAKSVGKQNPPRSPMFSQRYSNTTPSTSESRPDPQARMRHIATALEPTLDNLADGIHRLAQYRLAADSVTYRACALASDVVAAQDTQVKERSRTTNMAIKDVLGALGSAFAETGSKARSTD